MQLVPRNRLLLVGCLVSAAACGPRAGDLVAEKAGNDAKGGAGGASGGAQGGASSGALGGFPALGQPDGGVADDLGSSSLPLPVPPTWGGVNLDATLESDVQRRFDGAVESASTELEIVYPLAKSLHPVNLPEITVQWIGGGVATIYRLRFANARGTYDAFAACRPDQERCSYRMPDEAWREITRGNPDQDVDVTVSALVGARVLRSAPVSIRFSSARVEGGLYYWSTGLRGTYRLTFGQRKASPFIVPQKQCFGCHAVSRNGATIAWTVYDDMSLRVASTEKPEQRSGDAQMSSGTVALNPDGSRILVSFGGELTLRDNAGKELAKFTSRQSFGGKGVYFPEWSPDGKSLAVTVGPAMTGNDEETDDIFLSDAEIAVMSIEGTQLGPLRTVVPKTEADVHYYPSWSPDGRWLVFTSAPRGSRGSGNHPTTYDNPKARLRMVAATGGRVHELGLATQGSGNTSSWPKFTPFAQLGGDLLFITFGSRMPYGWLAADRQRPQLWMAAIDLRKLAAASGAGEDPSWAPVWLPFQELSQNNHLGYWTEKLVCQPGPAAESGCGDGAVCFEGRCVVPVE